MKLVLEGGGVRAAYGAGVVHALAASGVPIRAVVGSSSGSVNAAFLAAGQTATALHLWGDHIPGKHFINWQRQFTPWGKPGLDVDGMLDDVITGGGLLDREAATSGPTHLYITATDVRAGRTVVVRPAPHNLMPWLRASLALPVGYNRVVEVEGHACVDGGVTSPVAFDEPLPEEYPGPTVVVLTRPVDTAKPAPKLWERWAIRTIVPVAARALTLRQHELHNAVMGRLQAAEARGEVIVVNPPAELPLSRLTRDAGRIRAGIALGEEVGRALGERLGAARWPWIHSTVAAP